MNVLGKERPAVPGRALMGGIQQAPENYKRTEQLRINSETEGSVVIYSRKKGALLKYQIKWRFVAHLSHH
jgi:hypothetical protein